MCYDKAATPAQNRKQHKSDMNLFLPAVLGRRAVILRISAVIFVARVLVHEHYSMNVTWMAGMNDSLAHNDSEAQQRYHEAVVAVATVNESNVGYDYYWDSTCPFEEPRYSLNARADRKKLARELSIVEAKNHKKIQSILDGGALADRNIVFVGDSIYKQIHTSIGCLAGRERLGPHVCQSNACHRAILKSATSATNSSDDAAASSPTATPATTNLFLNYDAGQLLEKLGTGFTKDIHWENQQSWIEACRSREPFYFYDSYIPPDFPLVDTDYHQVWLEENHATNTTTTSSNHTMQQQKHPLEKIPLSAQDYVFAYGTLHGSTTAAANKKIQALGKCMADAQVDGTAHPDWPTVGYVVQQPSHFSTKSGNYNSNNAKAHGCVNATREVARASLLKSIDTMQNRAKLPVVGRKTLYQEFEQGFYHAQFHDCVHWIAPGVIDFMAVEVMEWIAQDTTHNKTRMIPQTKPPRPTPTTTTTKTTSEPFQ